jgi:hypothetical protein
LLPPELHSDSFYDDFEGLLARLRRAIREVSDLRSRSLQAKMARYDWRQMALEYDRRLSEVQPRGSYMPGL